MLEAMKSMGIFSSFLSKECFVSHCSTDQTIMQDFSKLIDRYYSKMPIFNTFDEKHTTKAGEERSNAIKKHLKKSSFMIAIITDNYLRSTICISELSAFWYMSKLIIPIVFNGTIGKNFLTELLGKDIIHIDASLSPEDCARKFIKAMEEAGFSPSSTKLNDAKQSFTDFFHHCHQAKSTRKYIGIGKEFEDIIQYCNEFGIHQFKNSVLSTSDIIQNLSGKDEIFMLSTTGSNMINSLSSEFLPKALMKGVNFTLLLPNKYSDYTTDVAEIEMPDTPFSNVERLSNEFKNVMINLCNVVKKAHGMNGNRTGHVYVGCTFNLLRQTLIFGKKENQIWGWASLTIPPKKTTDGTPSIEFSGSIQEPSMAKIMFEHFMAIKNIAQKRESSWIEISPQTNADTLSFGLEKISAKKEWKELYLEAKSNMENCKNRCTGILIEVAAQHPLMPDGSPGVEFKARLNVAIKLYQKFIAEGKTVHIYIPGSIHFFRGHADPISLSMSGKNYLISQQIPESCILGEEQNIKYKGNLGVYNSADECFVASKIFFNGNYSKIYCVCSPNQITRKQLFYIAFGIVPMIITVPCDELMHNPIYEIFEAVPNVIMHDHTWQGANSIQGQRTRKERNPELQQPPIYET